MAAKKEVQLNKSTGLLETKPHDYRLHDVPEPELYRGISISTKCPKPYSTI